MQPLNKKERTKAFWKFLLLLIVSIGLITATIFSSSNIPFRQNEQLINQQRIDEKDRSFSDYFINEMLLISADLDTVNNTPNPFLIENRIKTKISLLNTTVERDSVNHKQLYQKIVYILSVLYDAKKSLRDLSANNSSNAALQSKNEKLDEQLQKANAMIVDLNKQIADCRHK